MSGAAVPGSRRGGEPAPIPQRATLVLPSTGAYDSRAWRIASTLAGRGHAVTVLARQGDGLPDREDHPGGYRVIRVPVSAVGGLPWPIGPVVARLRPGRSRSDGLADSGTTSASAAPAPRRGPLAGLRRAWSAVIRLAAIALTVRSQELASRRVAPSADLVHAMAYMGIPVGLGLGGGGRIPVVYDARDIYVEARNIARLPVPARRLFGAVERRWAHRASRVMTVNRAYAEVMAERFGVPLPAIVLNCSPATDIPAPGHRFHERLDLPGATRIVLYHGGLTADRGIEQLIDALPAFPADTVLVLLGYGSRQAELERRAEDPSMAGRLHVLPAVPPGELLEWVASADVAAMPIQPTTLNHRLTTPNKLFEAMTAGVPVVAADLPGMATIVRETGCGVLCDPTSPAAIAAAVRAILDAPPLERAAYRERALAAARATYHWEAQAAVLLDEYRRLTGRPW